MASNSTLEPAINGSRTGNDVPLVEESRDPIFRLSRIVDG